MDFGNLFAEAKGQPITYKGQTIVMIDRFPVKDGEKLKICIEQTNSKYPQGLTVDITGSCEVQDKLFKKGKGIRMLFWEDAELIDPKNIELTVFTKKEHVVIYNIWERNKQLFGWLSNRGNNRKGIQVGRILAWRHGHDR